MDLTPWTLLVPVLGLLSFIAYTFIFQSQRTNEPPGNTGWPIVGESLKFMSAGKNGRPESFVRERMSKYSPDVFKTNIAGAKMAMICGAAGNKLVFTNNSMFAAWWPPTMGKIMVSEGSKISETKRIRTLVSQFLRPEALKDYVPIMDRLMKREIAEEWIAPNKEIKAFSLSKKLSFSTLCKVFMNIEDPGQVAKLKTHFAFVLAGLLAAPINFPGTTYNRAIKAANRLRREFYTIIKSRRAELAAAGNNTNSSEAKLDLLSYLVDSTKDESDEEVVLKEIADSILSVLVASHDSTSSVMAFAVFFLADHRDVYNQVLEEQMEIRKGKEAGEVLAWEEVNRMKYTRNVINEILRLAPPAPGGFKQTVTDVPFAGFTIPKGWKVSWSVHSTHKDPKYFDNPEEFNPSRFEGKGPAPYSFVPFGLGPHMCPGHEFARLKISIFIHNLVTRFRWEKLVPNENIIYNPLPIAAHDLPIRILPHVDE